MTGRYDAAFFDFGGTLFSYRDVGRKMFANTLAGARRLGASGEPRELGTLYRRANESAFKQMGTRAYYLHREIFENAFRGFAQLLGKEASPVDVEWFYNGQRDALVHGFSLRANCIETLSALRARGLHVSIVSNIDDDFLDPMVARSGLDAHLDAWTSSEEARSCKPDPGIFRLACEKAGVAPDRVMFVGDSREADIAGGRALGMTTVLIRDGDTLPPGVGAGEPGEPHHEIEDLAEVLALLES